MLKPLTRESNRREAKNRQELNKGLNIFRLPVMGSRCGLPDDQEASLPLSDSGRRIPREAPAVISMAPLRTSAFECSSAALAEAKADVQRFPAQVAGSQFLQYIRG